MIPPLRIVAVTDRLLSQLQQNIAQVLNALVQVPVVQGVRATLTVGTTQVHANTDVVLSHGLGRPPIDIIPTLPAYAATATPGFGLNWYRSKTISATPSQTVVLQATLALQPGASFNFWVY